MTILCKIILISVVIPPQWIFLLSYSLSFFFFFLFSSSLLCQWTGGDAQFIIAAVSGGEEVYTYSSVIAFPGLEIGK